jgi:hypothetical protein
VEHNSCQRDSCSFQEPPRIGFAEAQCVWFFYMGFLKEEKEKVLVTVWHRPGQLPCLPFATWPLVGSREDGRVSDYALLLL